MEETGVDPRELLDRIKADSRRLAWEPLPPSNAIGLWRQRPMRDEEPLEYLHRNWALRDHVDPGAVGGGLRGRVVSVFARLTFRVLGPYLREERELLARVVRMNDALARRCDELAQVVADRQVAEAENDARLAVWLSDGPRRADG
ncbi:MAG: hypothetical protein ACYDD6_09725 [Acidimicrobiales bacterium]